MSSEDKELLTRISRLAAQINRHKNQQAGITSVPAPSSSTRRPHATSSHRPYPRPYAPRGGYRGKPAAYRNRTLVLNGSSKGDGTDGTEAPSKSNASSTNGSWVSKTDRHMQLINSTVYEKEAPARTKAIEQTRLQNQQLKDDRERAKLRNHLRYLANSHGSGGGGSSNANTIANGRAPAPYQIVVQGIPFHVVKNGSKLVKAPGDPNPPSSTPKTAIVGGVKFFRSKNGNLYRHGVVKAQRRAGNVKKIDQPCKIFSTTGIPSPLCASGHVYPLLRMLRVSSFSGRLKEVRSRFADHCWTCLPLHPFYTGSCSKGPFCRYIHDPAKVAVCKEFLLKGHCASGDDCDLSHELTPERTPFCLHYAKGNCTNPNCPYTHSEVSTGALVCRPFGIYGYCEKGADCPERHVFECPDFSNTGVCKIKGCKLPHRERASFMRRATNAGVEKDADAEDADMVDASSDESVHSDDVDSDEVDEFVGADGEDADLDFVNQKDFIEF